MSPFALLFFSLAVNAFGAFSVVITPYEAVCYYEPLSSSSMDISFQVSTGGSLDIDFWIEDPKGIQSNSLKGVSTGTIHVDSSINGEYVYCFSNKGNSAYEKAITFVIQGPDERTKLELKYKDADKSQNDMLTETLTTLEDVMKSIRDEQAYMVLRERQHHATAESTKNRSLWWFMGQFIILIGVVSFQSVHVKGFFERRR